MAVKPLTRIKITDFSKVVQCHIYPNPSSNLTLTSIYSN